MNLDYVADGESLAFWRWNQKQTQNPPQLRDDDSAVNDVQINCGRLFAEAVNTKDKGSTRD